MVGYELATQYREMNGSRVVHLLQDINVKFMFVLTCFRTLRRLVGVADLANGL